MHAIGHGYAEVNPDAQILYMSAEKFMMEFVTAMRRKEVMEFKARLRAVDVLLIDSSHGHSQGVLDRIKATREAYPDLQIIGVLPTMYDARTLHSREVLQTVQQAFGDAVFQTVISAAASRAVLNNHPRAHVINCCFPDVVNGLLKAMGLPVTCGVGNVSILANSFAGVLNDAEGAAPDLRVLAHYQTIGAWRRPAAERAGPTDRVRHGSSLGMGAPNPQRRRTIGAT
jgi:hypothetical protein